MSKHFSFKLMQLNQAYPISHPMYFASLYAQDGLVNHTKIFKSEGGSRVVKCQIFILQMRLYGLFF